MQKKKILTQVLESLFPYRELAEGFLILIKESEDENFIDQVYRLILESIKKIKSQQLKQKLSENLKKLKETERLIKLREQEEADQIFNDLFDDLEDYAG